MAKLNSLLIGRFRNQPKKEKMNELAQRTSSKSFSSPFEITPITDNERESLKILLEKYRGIHSDIGEDLDFLSTITSEVKAISNQAVILHGERIKRAQQLFKNYKEGAFSSWLLKTYGNRQTPYNFMQYYELYTTLPKKLQGIVDEMPRQAIYSLSSRSVPYEKKEAFVESYQGESKTELLEKLRTSFPLAKKDRRNPNKAKTVIKYLKEAKKRIEEGPFEPFHRDTQEIKSLLREISALL